MHRHFAARILVWSLFAICTLPFHTWDTHFFSGLDSDAFAQKDGYISQTLIDTMVQQAFYEFHLAETAINPTKSQKQAIANAKAVVAKLRRMAKGDANEKYILFKVSELEQHTYLEEKDLLLKKMKEGQKSLNQLIAQYNAELAKDRPDFRMLVSLHAQVEKIDIGKANQIASSINQRNRNVAREVSFSLEKKMLTGDHPAARRELDYCKNQQGYLNVSQSRWKQWENKLAQIEKADLQRAGLKEQLDRAESLVAQKSLSKAWRLIPQLQNSINTAKDLSDRQAIEFRGRVTSLINAIDHIEDSLVNRSNSILKHQGVDPAIDFMQTVLNDYGVSRSCVMKIDSAIMAVAPKTQESSGAIRKELSALVHGGGSNSSLTMENARDIARKRAQAKMDSIHAVEEARARKAAVEQARQDSIRLVELEKRERKLRKHRVKARKKMVKIIDLLEKGRVKKAYRRFKRHQDKMQQYMEESSYAMLQQTVLLAYSDRNKKKKEDKKKEIIQVRQTPRPEPKKVAAPQSSRAEKAMEEQNRQKQNDQRQQQAQEIIIDIYTLLENNQIRQAYDRFDMNRELMRTEIGGEPYAMLEQTVMQTYENLQEYIQNTSSPAASSASANTERKPQASQTQNNESVEYQDVSAQQSAEPQNDNRYENTPADTQDYFSLEKARENQTDTGFDIQNQASSSSERQSDQQKAQRYITYLYKLLEQNQVEEAFQRFQKIREPLQKYSDPVAYQTLESILLQSYQHIKAN